MTEGIQLLKKTKSDILFVTDPDADRLGVVINHYGDPIILNGHELAVLGAYYLCDRLSQKHQLSKKSTIVTTIVTTPLLDRIAKAYKVKTVRVLTGFKYIGEKIREWNNSEEAHSFLFGAEESHGYLIGSYCRDKDGISAACLFARMAAELKAQGKTCLDLLYEIYAKFGVFQEKTISLTFSDGKDGVETVQNLMRTLREDPPSSLGDQTIVRTVDYLEKVSTLPRADVLQWSLEDGSTLIIRPSGTEPKLKAYLSCYRPVQNSIQDVIAECRMSLQDLSNVLKNHLESIITQKQLL